MISTVYIMLKLVRFYIIMLIFRQNSKLSQIQISALNFHLQKLQKGEICQKIGPQPNHLVLPPQSYHFVALPCERYEALLLTCKIEATHVIKESTQSRFPDRQTKKKKAICLPLKHKTSNLCC